MSEVLSTKATQTELWQQLVRDGSVRTGAGLDEDLESYLVFTLMRLTQDQALLARVMALEFLEACGRSGRVRQQCLRDVGDRCLILVGLFPEQARRRRVSLDYFSSLGQEAYDELGSALQRSLGELYRRLAATFGVLTRVLLEVRRQAHGHAWIDPLQRHELCQRQGHVDPTLAAQEFPGAIVLSGPQPGAVILDLIVLFGFGALAGLLAGLLGIGGGLVLVPLLAHWWQSQGIPTAHALHLAVACSAASIVATGSASAWSHHRAGRVHWPVVWAQAPGLLLGAGLGALLVGVLPATLLGVVVAVFCAYAAWSLVGGSTASAATEGLPSARGLLTVATGIGALSAAVGIGGGSLNVPYLHQRGLELKHAIGTSAAAGIPIALAAALGYAWAPGPGRAFGPLYGLVDVGVVAAIALGSMPFAPLGAWLAGKTPVPWLKRVFALYLILVAAQLSWTYVLR